MSCPCCGYSADKKHPAEIGRLLEMTKVERLIFDSLLQRFGSFVRREVVIYDIYFDDIDGGPDDATGVLAVTLGRLRKKLEAYGLTVVSKRGRGANGICMAWAAA